MNFLKSKTALKLLALLAAIGLWIFVVNEGFRVDYLEKEVSVKAYNLREDLAIASDLGKVKLKVRAPQNLWQELSGENIEAYVDLKTFDPGVYDVEVKVSSQDPKIQILEKNPEKTRVVLEFQTSIKKDINVEIRGSAGSGFYAGSPLVTPGEIEIKGAKSVLDKIDQVKTIAELNGETNEIKKEPEIIVLDRDGKKIENIVFSPDKAQITVPILRESETKSVSVKAKTSGELPSGYMLEKTEINPQFVNIRGRKENIANIYAIETEEINISDLKTTTEKTVNLVLPENVESIEPRTVKVKITIASTITTREFEAPINFKNLGDNLEVKSYEPLTVSLVLEGSGEALNSLNNKPATINLNLQGKNAGTYNFSITGDMVSLPERITLKSIKTKEVKLIIIKKE